MANECNFNQPIIVMRWIFLASSAVALRRQWHSCNLTENEEGTAKHTNIFEKLELRRFGILGSSLVFSLSVIDLMNQQYAVSA